MLFHSILDFRFSHSFIWPGQYELQKGGRIDRRDGEWHEQIGEQHPEHRIHGIWCNGIYPAIPNTRLQK